MPDFVTEVNNVISEKASTNNGTLEDKNIHCIDCSQDFIWTIGEQVFFRDKGLQNPPKRCKPCKQAKTERIEAVIAAQQAGVKQKIEVSVNCAKCNSLTTVPFYPSQGRPVFCRSCFIAMNPEILTDGNNGNSNGNRH
jgi:CxxC-x17-CxxC domain-containing protein